MTPIAERESAPRFERLGYIEKSSPYINPLLRNNDNILIFPEKFGDIINQADRFEEVTLLDQMNRQTDVTGFVSEFVGRCTTPEEVQAELDAIADRVLHHLANEPKKLQNNVTKTLTTTSFCTLDALKWLDIQHGELVKELKAIRAPEAEQFRQRNIEAIRKTNNTTIIYVPTYWSGDRHLTEVTRYIHIPQLPKENQQILNQLTPIFFNRNQGFLEKNPTLNIKFIREFRKSGDALTRILAQNLEESAQLEAYRNYVENQP